MRKAEYAYVVIFVGLIGALFCVLYLMVDG